MKCISQEIIDTLLGSYKANQIELAEVELNWFKYREQNTEPSESFEQGYNNALELVFNKLNINFRH